MQFISWKWATCISLCVLSYSVDAQRKNAQHNYLDKTKTANEIRSIDNKLEKLYHMFCGEFSSQAQADTASIPALAVGQDIIAVPIWTERKGEYWFYMGWFKIGQPEHSLVQGICKLTKEGRDTFRVTTHTLPNENLNNYYSLEWKKSNPFNDLKPKDLIAHEGCSNLIVAGEANEFRVLADSEPCPRNMSDVLQYFELQGRFTPEVLYYASYFYDKDKQVVLDYGLLGGSLMVRTPKELARYAIPNKKQAKHK